MRRKTMTEAELRILQAELVGEMFIDPENPKLLAHDVTNDEHGIVVWASDGMVQMIGSTITQDGGIKRYMDYENNIGQKPIAKCRQAKAHAALLSGAKVQVYLIRPAKGVAAEKKAFNMRREYKLPWSLDGQ